MTSDLSVKPVQIQPQEMPVTITDDDIQAHLADNIIARENEVFHYQVNIDNYTAMLQQLPSEDWPDGLQQYKTMTTEQIASAVPDEQIDYVSSLVFRDRIKLLLRTEKIEQAKASMVHQALVARANPTTLQTNLATAALKRAAALQG